MARSGIGRNGAKAVMRPAPERKPRMQLALGGEGRQGLGDPAPERWPRKPKMRLDQSGGCRHSGTPNLCSAAAGTARQLGDGSEPGAISRWSSARPALGEQTLPADADGWYLRQHQRQPAGDPDSQELRDHEATPRRRHAADADGPLASSQGCTPSATASPSPERPEILERLEHPVLAQAAAALAELARSQARAAAMAEALRLEREARGRDEAAHCAERERLRRAADGLQMQLAARRRDSCDTGITLRPTSSATADCEAASEEPLLEIERENPSKRGNSRGVTTALRAARAEAQLLPHTEIAERCRVEYSESEARRRLMDSKRTACVAAAAELRGASGALAILQTRGGADPPAAGAAHPDAGWFLTLDIIALSVAPFAPRSWAPVCRDTAEAVCNVHKFWHNASNRVQERMMRALGMYRQSPGPSEWLQPRLDWGDLIDDIGRTPTDDVDARRRLCIRARLVHNVLERLQLDYQDALSTMRCTNVQIQGTRRVMIEVLGK